MTSAIDAGSAAAAQSGRAISRGRLRWVWLAGLLADTLVSLLVLRLLCRLAAHRPPVWMLLPAALASALLATTVERAWVRFRQRRIVRECLSAESTSSART